MATSNRTSYHITPNSGNGWKLEQELVHQPMSIHNTKSEAQREGHHLAERSRPSLLITHRADGTIQNQNSYD